MVTKRIFYITQSAKNKVSDLDELIQDFEENFPNSFNLEKEGYSNINYSVMELINSFGRRGPSQDPNPIEITEDSLLQEGWTRENIQELIDEGYLEEIEIDAMDELKLLVQEKGIFGIFEPSEEEPEPINKVSNLLEKVLSENKPEDLPPFEYSMISWIRNNCLYFKQMVDLEKKLFEN